MPEPAAPPDRARSVTGAGPGELRVVFVVDSDAYGGAEAYVGQLLRRLPPRFDRTLLCAPPVAPLLRGPATDHGRLEVVPLSRGADHAPALRRALACLQPDVVHVNLVDPASNRAAMAAAVAVAPTVATLHLDGGTGDGRWRTRLAELYGRLTTVIAVSRTVCDQLVAELGVPPERVRHVRNGIDLVTPAVQPSGRDRLAVGAVGRLTPQKGFDLLVEATRTLVGRGRHFEVVVAGEGRDRHTLERAAQGLPVRFLGFRRDVPSFLRGVDLFCLPSRREGLPLALLEAMSAGLPCVTTAVGDIRDAVGDDVLLVEAEDVATLAGALDRLLVDPSLRAELGGRARRRAVADFDGQRMTDHTAAVLAAAAHPGR